MRVLAARSIGSPERTYVCHKHIGIANKRLCGFYFVLYLSEAIGLELHSVHKVNQRVRYQIGLIGNVGVVKQVVGLIAKKVVEEVVVGYSVLNVCKIYLAVDVEHVDNLSYLFVCGVISHCHVVVLCQYDGYNPVSQQYIADFCQGGVGVFACSARFEVAKIDKTQRFPMLFEAV